MAKKKDNSPASDLSVEQKSMIGPHLNFAASEAYKLLRTNLLFSFPAEEKCHVIGITSSFQGEGKSMTSINLSYTLAEANNRVLLIEGDMRIPNFSNRLNLKKTPGLSNLLAGLDSISDAIQRIAFRRSSNPEPVKFDVITAGNIPPNPSELMQSHRMQQLIDTLKVIYPYMITSRKYDITQCRCYLLCHFGFYRIAIIHGCTCIKKDAYTALPLFNIFLRAPC